MEVDVGSHCAMQGCHQLDFLPFKCDSCQKKFCEIHRQYKSHDCSGESAKDVTSLDCPICGKSIRFTRDVSADLRWEQHYSDDCSRKPAAVPKPPEKCPAAMCRAVLGVSNAMSCSKCGVRVCISHRMPEDHACGIIPKPRIQSMHKKIVKTCPSPGLNLQGPPKLRAVTVQS